MFAKISFVLIFIFLIAPILTSFHELGHAAIPLLKGEVVKISVGENFIFKFQIQNLNVEFGLLKPWIGYATWPNEGTILQLLLGPLVSLIFGTGFFILSLRVGEFKSLFMACAGWCLFQFLFTIIPMNYPTFLGYGHAQQSDGRQIVESFKKSYNAK
jgi:hypothetical protein